MTRKMTQPLDLITAEEANALIAHTMHRWTAEDRRRVALAMPAVYARLTGTIVTVVAGADVPARVEINSCKEEV